MNWYKMLGVLHVLHQDCKTVLLKTVLLKMETNGNNLGFLSGLQRQRCYTLPKKKRQFNLTIFTAPPGSPSITVSFLIIENEFLSEFYRNLHADFLDNCLEHGIHLAWSLNCHLWSCLLSTLVCEETTEWRYLSMSFAQAGCVAGLRHFWRIGL